MGKTARRRMFDIDILDSDAFLDMPLSAQMLYIHLAERADDDGFIGNPRAIRRYVGASNEDLDILIEKRFLLKFRSEVVCIKHWKKHNHLRADRKAKTSYTDELAMLNEKEDGTYTFSEVEQHDTKSEDNIKSQNLTYSENKSPKCENKSENLTYCENKSQNDGQLATNCQKLTDAGEIELELEKELELEIEYEDSDDLSLVNKLNTREKNDLLEKCGSQANYTQMLKYAEYQIKHRGEPTPISDYYQYITAIAINGGFIEGGQTG